MEMSSIFGSVESRVEAFVRSNPRFLESTQTIFDGLESGGRISLDDMTRAVAILFDMLGTQLDHVGIAVRKPSRPEVQELLRASHAEHASGLDEQEFKVKPDGKKRKYHAHRASSQPSTHQ